jgi:hypothetical protein
MVRDAHDRIRRDPNAVPLTGPPIMPYLDLLPRRKLSGVQIGFSPPSTTTRSGDSESEGHSETRAVAEDLVNHVMRCLTRSA